MGDGFEHGMGEKAFVRLLWALTWPERSAKEPRPGQRLRSRAVSNFYRKEARNVIGTTVGRRGIRIPWAWKLVTEIEGGRRAGSAALGGHRQR